MAYCAYCLISSGEEYPSFVGGEGYAGSGSFAKQYLHILKAKMQQGGFLIYVSIDKKYPLIRDDFILGLQFRRATQINQLKKL